MNKDYARGLEDGLELASLEMEKAKDLDSARKSVRHLLSLVKERRFSYLISLLEEIR